MRIADGVRRAVNRLESARAGRALGRAARPVLDRRWFMKPGAILAHPFGRSRDRVMMNPGVGNPNLARPADPVILFALAEGQRALAFPAPQPELVPLWPATDPNR